MTNNAFIDRIFLVIIQRGLTAANAAFIMRNEKFLLVLTCVINIVLLFCACDVDFTPKPLEPISNPKLALTEFVENLNEHDFEEGYKYISNYADLGFDEVQSDSDAVTMFMRDALLESYRVEFLNNENIMSITDTVSESDYFVTGTEASVDVVFTALDINAIAVRMTELATEIGYEHKFNGYVYDSEEKAEGLILEVLEVIKTEDIEHYYSSYNITVDLEYTDNMWKIIMTDELYDILLGGNNE